MTKTPPVPGKQEEETISGTRVKSVHDKKIRAENITATKENRQRKPSEGMHMNLLTSMSSEFKNHGG